MLQLNKYNRGGNSIYVKFVWCAWLQKIIIKIAIDHFTVVCPVTWSLNGSEARGELVLIQTSLLLLCKSSCSNANQVYLHDKCREVCIKARSPLASLQFKGQVSQHTTVKWPISVIFAKPQLTIIKFVNFVSRSILNLSVIFPKYPVS